MPESSSRRDRADLDALYPPQPGAMPLVWPQLTSRAVRALLPPAFSWAADQQALARDRGRGLSDDELTWAIDAGVSDPASVRVVIGALPEPADEELARSLRRLGLDPRHLNGITLGHAVFISDRVLPEEFATVLSHELRHVKQREDAGSLEAYLRSYVKQVNRYGYRASGFEDDAYRHQR